MSVFKKIGRLFKRKNKEKIEKEQKLEYIPVSSDLALKNIFIMTEFSDDLDMTIGEEINKYGFVIKPCSIKNGKGYIQIDISDEKSFDSDMLAEVIQHHIKQGYLILKIFAKMIDFVFYGYYIDKNDYVDLKGYLIGVRELPNINMSGNISNMDYGDISKYLSDNKNIIWFEV